MAKSSSGSGKIAFFSGDITRSGGTERVGTLIANALAARGHYEDRKSVV